MSTYKKLNDMQIDVSQYEEEQLTELEQKRWEKRVNTKLHKQKKSRSKKWIVGTVAASVLAIGLSIPFGGVSLAKVPFVGGLIEQFIDQNNPPNYSTYKTAIGETSENKYGKMTLNEVLVDTDSLLISSTFEPAQGISFNYQTHLFPTVLVNGQNLTVIRGTQSIEVNDDMYTIYGDIKLSELPTEGPLQIKLTYDTISKSFKDDVVIEDPWVFDIKASTDQMMKDTKTVQLDKTITLHNGEKVKLNKIVSSPVSTVLYYNLTRGSENTHFKLVSATGEELEARVTYAHDSGEPSYSRFDPVDLENGKFSLVPINSDNAVTDREVVDYKEVGPSVPIK
ncbi:DUF4179 domain-containing protein [Paenibacillus sp. DMB20]|uniref:DUF4179 domain-containing protein n=1 Tax=Paenibacillus sp. DMB20 TaxID=1642570 RepID=UPI000627BEFD|nr:DUF4179 domain-containing protein [Paenibacillus sp. DMB20]KKO54566.1 hypothetical protein XI25_05725 [Paenibacillus sp. DMB20]